MPHAQRDLRRKFSTQAPTPSITSRSNGTLRNRDFKDLDERSSWLAYNLAQEPKNDIYQSDLRDWLNDNVQSPASDDMRTLLYFNILRRLSDQGNTDGALHVISTFARMGIRPAVSLWVLFFQSVLKEQHEPTTVLIEVFKALPKRKRRKVSSQLLEWMYLERLNITLFRERWLYSILIFGAPISNERTRYLTNQLIPFYTKSVVLSDPLFYKSFLRQLAHDYGEGLSPEAVLGFVSATGKMPLQMRARTIQTFILAVNRFSKNYKSHLFSEKFWATLIEHHTELSDSQITHLINVTGAKITKSVYEGLILRNSDFEQCTALSNEYSNACSSSDEHLSFQVYSHMIRLLCNYSPRDAATAFREENVRCHPQLSVGYFMGLFEARDYQSVVETFKSLEKDNFDSSPLWNIYVHALTKLGKVGLAFKLAMNSLGAYSHSLDYNPPSFNSGLITYLDSRKQPMHIPQVEPKKLITSTHTIDFAPIYTTPEPSINLPSNNNTEHQLQRFNFTKSKYLLTNVVFTKVAMAMIYHNREPITKRRTRKYFYGKPTDVEQDNHFSENEPREASDMPDRFTILQMVYYLQLGARANGKLSKGDTPKPAFQLQPQHISHILRDIQSGRLQFTMKEFIIFIHSLAELYPDAEIKKTFPEVVTKKDVFNRHLISRLVHIAYFKSPRTPWHAVQLLRELHDDHGIPVDVKQVKNLLINATATVYGSQPVKGELQRLRHQFDHSNNLYELAESFNNAWTKRDGFTQETLRIE